jgi:3',5'-cyclic AMP phosphodiesterase CpdA
MLRVLHLSDLHFGILSKDQQDKHHCKPSAHQFARGDGSQPDDDELAKVVIKDPALKEPPDLVIVSGDLGWSGAAQDYVHVLAFLNQLRDTWKHCKFVLAPGNHDVDWSRLAVGTPPVDQSQDAYLDLVRSLYGTDFASAYKFLEVGPPLNRESLVGFHHGDIRGQSFLVVSVNSAAHIAGKDKSSIHIRPTILRKIDDALRSISADLRIFVLHHHLLPFADPSGSGVYDPRAVPDKPDPTMVANSAKLQTWLAQHAFSLVVHGHKHLSHGRTDVLWKTDSETGRRLFIVGAGSAGVASHERAHSTPLGYNLITLTQLSSTRWQADVAVRQIAEDGAYPAAADHYAYVADLGPPSDAAPVVIHAARADQCHEAIRVRAEGKPMLHNFMSIVDDGKYVDCPTARSDGREISQGEIVRSFEALHPEYGKSERWQKRNQIEAALHDAGPRFQFSHGPRLFGIPEAARKLSDRDLFRPIVRALDNLTHGNTSNAYVGLFRPEIDVVSSRNEPLPALVGIQFIPQDNNRLDLVATYRKLELSYWWVVNMYEAAELLKWGSSYTKRRSGRITFFAPLAEWKLSPETTFVTTLDKAELVDLVALLMKLANDDADARASLRMMLEEKHQHTNEKNLDPQGLKHAIAILSGLGMGGSENGILKSLAEDLTRALLNIEAAMAEHRDDDGLVGKAKEALAAAIGQLQDAKR